MPVKRSYSKPFIVITRPEEDAQTLAKAISAQGFQPFIEPMLTIKTLMENPSELKNLFAKRPQAILATSKHAVSALAVMVKERSTQLIVVGQATADYAKNLGFKSVTAAGGTAKLMVSSIAKELPPAQGSLLYLRGKNTTMDMAAALAKKGFRVDSVVLYEAKTSRSFSAALRDAINANHICAVLFFSARTAKAYAKLVEKHRLAEQHRTISALCISKTVADALGRLQWRKILVATAPNKKNLMKLLPRI